MDYTQSDLLRNIREAGAQYGRSATQLAAFKGKTSGEGAQRLQAKMDEAYNIRDYSSDRKQPNAPSSSAAIAAWNAGSRGASAQASLKQTNASDRFGARKAAIAKKVK